MLRKILHEDDELKVIWQPGTSDYLLITFGDLISLASEDKFYADVPATKLDLNCIGFMAKKANWFPATNMRAAYEKMAAILEKFACRVTYGGSMGGFAAIKYSGLLGASETIAFCPQWSIDPAECLGESSGYERYFQPGMVGMGIRAQDLSGNICILFDPGYKTDAFHYQRIKSLCSDAVLPINVHRAGHHVTSILAGTANLADIIDLFRAGDIAQLKILVNEIRRKSPIRKRLILQKAIHRHRLLVYRALANSRLATDIGLIWANTLHSELLDFFIANNQFQEANEVISRFPGIICKRRIGLLKNIVDNGLNGTKEQSKTLQQPKPDKPKKLLPKLFFSFVQKKQQTSLPTKETDSLQGAGNCELMLTTHHKTLLSYGLFHGKLSHASIAAIEAKPLDLHPVLVAKAAGSEVIAVRICGQEFACHVEPNGLVSLIPIGELSAQQCEGCISKGEAIQNAFTLRLRNRYICAAPDGSLVYNRSLALAWETFSHKLPLNSQEIQSHHK